MSLSVDPPSAMLGLTRFGEEFHRQNSGSGLEMRKQFKKDRFHAMEAVLGLLKDN